MDARPKLDSRLTEPSRDPSASRSHRSSPAGQEPGRAAEDGARDGRREGEAVGNGGEAGLQELGTRAPGPQQEQSEETVIPNPRRTAEGEPPGAQEPSADGRRMPVSEEHGGLQRQMLVTPKNCGRPPRPAKEDWVQAVSGAAERGNVGEGGLGNYGFDDDDGDDEGSAGGGAEPRHGAASPSGKAAGKKPKVYWEKNIGGAEDPKKPVDFLKEAVETYRDHAGVSKEADFPKGGIKQVYNLLQKLLKSAGYSEDFVSGFDELCVRNKLYRLRLEAAAEGGGGDAGRPKRPRQDQQEDDDGGGRAAPTKARRQQRRSSAELEALPAGPSPQQPGPSQQPAAAAAPGADGAASGSGAVGRQDSGDDFTTAAETLYTSQGMYDPKLKAAAALVALVLDEKGFRKTLLSHVLPVRRAAEEVAKAEVNARAARTHADEAQKKLVQAVQERDAALDARLAEGEARPSQATRSFVPAEKAWEEWKAAYDAAVAEAGKAAKARNTQAAAKKLEDTLNRRIKHFAERQQGVAAAAPGDGGGGMNGSQLPALLHWASGCLSALSPRDQWAAAETATATAGDASSSGRPPQVCVDQLLQAAKRLPGDPDGQPGPLGRVAYAFQREALEFCLGLVCWQQAPAARLSGSPA